MQVDRSQSAVADSTASGLVPAVVTPAPAPDTCSSPPEPEPERSIRASKVRVETPAEKVQRLAAIAEDIRKVQALRAQWEAADPAAGPRPLWVAGAADARLRTAAAAAASSQPLPDGWMEQLPPGLCAVKGLGN